jgi:DNA-binding NarL/FixJ family response regulator
VRLAQQLGPDVVLMDARMPGMDGIEATRKIKAAIPQTKVIILTGIEDDRLLFDAVKAGASGFLLKKLDGDSLNRSLRELQAGRNPFSPGMEDLLLQKFSSIGDSRNKKIPLLTGRQIRILEWLYRGMTYKEIGIELCIGEQAVKYHIGRIKQQCGLKTQMELRELYRDVCLPAGRSEGPAPVTEARAPR